VTHATMHSWPISVSRQAAHAEVLARASRAHEITKAYDRTAHSRGVRARRQEAAGGQPALGDRHVNSARPMAALPSDKRCGTCKQSAQWESGNLGDTR